VFADKHIETIVAILLNFSGGFCEKDQIHLICQKIVQEASRPTIIHLFRLRIFACCLDAWLTGAKKEGDRREVAVNHWTFCEVGYGICGTTVLRHQSPP
jgi:hypothetical protein